MAGMNTTIRLNNGQQMPLVGLGTWQSQPGEVTLAVKAALNCGYKHIDCAQAYGNENEVGAAFKEVFAEGKVKREDIFITSKIWSNKHKPEYVKPCLLKTLNDLGLKYLDLYLIHWPIAFQPGDNIFPRDKDGNLIFTDDHYLDTWKELEKLVDEGLVKSIGLSNFNSEQIDDVIKNGRIKPVVNQVELHPYFNQNKLVKFCRERGVVVTAYSPLGSPSKPWPDPKPMVSLMKHPVITELGQKYGKSPAQVIIRWVFQQDIVVIPKSVTSSRIKENFEVFDFTLTDQDMEAINALNENVRLIYYGNGISDCVTTAPYFPFNIEF